MPQAPRHTVPQNKSSERTNAADAGEPPGHPVYGAALGLGGVLDAQGMIGL